MDRVRFIQHRDKKILLVDATGCTAQELIKVAEQVQDAVTAQPAESVLSLSDFSGATFDREAITRLKEVAAFDHPYVKRAAMVGGDDIPKVLLEALKNFAQRDFAQFESREAAMDWLAMEK